MTTKTFADKVRDVVRKIPKGKTMTYKQVAVKAGNPNAARAVGAVMRTNYDPTVPCHRVIKSDGSLGSYNRGGTLKKIGTAARKELESILGTKIFLELYVKVLKNWRENPQIVRQLDWHWQLEHK